MTPIKRADFILRCTLRATPFGAGGADIIRQANNFDHQIPPAGCAQGLCYDACHVGSERIRIAFALIAQRAQEMMGAEFERRQGHDLDVMSQQGLYVKGTALAVREGQFARAAMLQQIKRALFDSNDATAGDLITDGHALHGVAAQPNKRFDAVRLD